MVMSPTGLGTKSHCAGEAQQQFTRQTRQLRVSAVKSENLVAEERKRPPLEAATKQRLVKTEKIFCVL
jgi:hypothetical protein